MQPTPPNLVLFQFHDNPKICRCWCQQALLNLAHLFAFCFLNWRKKEYFDIWEKTNQSEIMKFQEVHLAKVACFLTKQAT